ncbi:SPOC domain-like protein [Testicularia cyperi]|uniref:ATP-dependent DNA helicase II subunit 1 n=1 Tax=Testicularia cyperi TaxID=1882483 RepID=A0A317XW93_9BASI|nr:SPOC domain-like protein [Testicularia cyperi]
MPKAYFVDRREAARAESDDDDEHEEIDFEATYQKDVVLFCIDAGPSMHRTNAEGTTHLYTALSAAASLMEKKLISSPHDHVGVMLFNCAETLFKSARPGEYYRGSYELQTIRQVNVPDTYNLKALLKEADQDPKHLQHVLPPAEKQMRVDWALANAGVAMIASANAGSKRVFYITDNDDPHPFGTDAKSTKARTASLDKMGEFRRIGVRVEPFFISSETLPFQINKFYADVFSQYDEDDDEGGEHFGPRAPKGFGTTSSEQLRGQEVRRHVWDAAVRFQELEDDITTRETPKRVVFNLRFELAALEPASKDEQQLPQAKTRGRKWQIGVKGYSLISRTTKGNAVKVIVDDECGELKEVVTHQHYVDANTGQTLTKEQVLPAFQFGDSSSLRGQVTFKSDELKKIKSFGMLPCLKLLGFKDRSWLQFHWNVKHAYFIYPSDVEWKGSKKTFAALLASMVKKNKIGLGLFMPRQNVVPVFVAIVPQPEEVLDGQQINPPGMQIITLPYADDIRDIPHNLLYTEGANDEQVEAAMAIIERYQKRQPFNPDHYPNPSLNHHYAVLMATAFQESLPEAVEDVTLPSYASIRKRTAHLIQDWHDRIDGDARLAAVAKSARATGKSSGAGTAKSKTSFEDDAQIVALWQQGKLGAYTVDELRSACEFYRLDKKGKKAELTERIGEHLDKMTK